MVIRVLRRWVPLAVALLLGWVVPLRAAAQMIVTDPGNTMQSVLEVFKSGEIFLQMKSSYESLKEITDAVSKVSSVVSTGQEILTVMETFKRLVNMSKTMQSGLQRPEIYERMRREQVLGYSKRLVALVGEASGVLKEARRVVQSDVYSMTDAERKALLRELNGSLLRIEREMSSLDESSARVVMDSYRRAHQFDFMRRY